MSSNSPLSSQVRKGGGHPPKVPPSSPVPSVSAQKISLETIVECLNKINEQNKALLNIVEVLSNKVENNASAENAAISQGANSVPMEQNSVLKVVNNRLNKIEQNLNSNTLICRGPSVENLINESVSGESTNLELIKGKVCAAVCGGEVTGVNVWDLQLSVYGRDKKCIRLTCANLVSKIYLLKHARQKKPSGIFVNEFLTNAKLKIYKNLRNLKAQHPNKIKAVFTTNRNVLYTLHDVNQLIHASSLDNLSGIICPEVPSTGSTSF